MIYSVPVFSTQKIADMGYLITSLIFSSANKPQQISRESQYDTHVPNKEIQVYSENNNLFEYMMKLYNTFFAEHDADVHQIVYENLELLESMTSKSELTSLKQFSTILITIAYCVSLNSVFEIQTQFDKLLAHSKYIGKSTSAYDVLNEISEAYKDLSQLPPEKQNHYSYHVNQIYKFISLHYSEDISLNDVTNNLHVTPEYISHILKKESGYSFTDLVNLARIKQSKILLQNSTKTIGEIAIAVGYNYQSYFSKVFKRFVGMTPKEFRIRLLP